MSISRVAHRHLIRVKIALIIHFEKCSMGSSEFSGWVMGKVASDLRLGSGLLLVRTAISSFNLTLMLVVADLANTKWLKKLKKYWNAGIWVLIWEYTVRTIIWIPTWQGLDGFQKSLHLCAWDKNSLSIGRVKAALIIHIEQCSLGSSGEEDIAAVPFSTLITGLLTARSWGVPFVLIGQWPGKTRRRPGNCVHYRKDEQTHGSIVYSECPGGLMILDVNQKWISYSKNI